MRWRRAAKVLIVIVALLAIAIVSLVYTDSGQNFLLRRVERFAADIGFPFHAQRLRLDPSNLTLSLTDFVYDKDGVRVSIRRLALAFPWKVYTSDGVTIRSVDADGVEVRIVSPEPILPEPSGKTNRLS